MKEPSWISPLTLRQLGIMGMNRRNIGYIAQYNPRHRYPLVDDKLKSKVVAQKARLRVPDLLHVVETQHDIEGIEEQLKDLSEFAIKPARGSGGTSFRPEKLVDLSLTAPGAILDAVTDALGISDQVTSQQRTILLDYLTDAGARQSLDLEDDDTRNRKLHGLFGLLLQSPAHQLH